MGSEHSVFRAFMQMLGCGSYCYSFWFKHCIAIDTWTRSYSMMSRSPSVVHPSSLDSSTMVIGSAQTRRRIVLSVADSWLLDHRLDAARVSIQKIMNALDDCRAEHEELLKMWSNLNNLTRIMPIMAKHLNLVQCRMDAFAKANVALDTCNKLSRKLDFAFQDLHIIAATVLEEMDYADDENASAAARPSLKKRTLSHSVLHMRECRVAYWVEEGLVSSDTMPCKDTPGEEVGEVSKKRARMNLDA